MSQLQPPSPSGSAVAAAAHAERVILGQVSGASGLLGWIKVYSDTRPRASIGDYPYWQLGSSERKGSWQAWQIDRVKPQGKRLIAKLHGCDTREQAETLIGHQIAVERTQLAQLPTGHYYWADLLGLEVVNECGESFGNVADIFDTGSNDVLVVRGERERLIPWHMGTVIQSVDLRAARLVVAWGADY